MKAKKHKPQALNNEFIRAKNTSTYASFTTCGF
jgi:hypothetical protein